MGDFSTPGLRRYFKIAKVIGWTGAAGGLCGGFALGVMGIHGIFGAVVGLGAAAIGVVVGGISGAVVAIPIAIGATVVGNVIKKSFGLGKQPPQPALPQVAPQPVVQVVKESIQEVKSAAQEFNAEAAVELADNMTFRKLKLSAQQAGFREQSLTFA